MIGKSMTPYCSVFYIPLFPEGKGEPFMECTNCGGKYHGDVGQLKARLANRMLELNAEIQKKQQSCAADPSDLQAASDLVELLVEAERVDEGQQLAERLTEAHPENANVHVVLARVHLHRGNMERTFQALRQAIAINPQHAGAQYYSAIAMMSVDPPRIDEALSCAKLAADNGHPEARDLIQAIEQAKASGR
jgi:tetratricopeptide (TPR) repeat protein